MRPFRRRDYFERSLVGSLIGSSVSVERRESDWLFVFSNGFNLSVLTLWRLRGVDSIFITSEDDGHQYGLPTPVDAEDTANRLLDGQSVRSLQIDAVTGDLQILFSGQQEVEVLTTSSGYESWTMSRPGHPLIVSSNGRIV